MNSWLNQFAYKINVGATVFIVAFVAILLITLITVGYQAIKAALANPVKSLRTE
jgi:putative ABC transport system permease protein